jgi:four helix bundle protein
MVDCRNCLLPKEIDLAVRWRTELFLSPERTARCPPCGTGRFPRTANCELRPAAGRVGLLRRAEFRAGARLLIGHSWAVDHLLSFAEWEKTAQNDGGADPLWRMTAYRLAAYAAECGWQDVRSLGGNQLTRAMAAQLYQAIGSIAANIAEGYSRSSGRDRVRFFEYALGSAREARAWYRLGRPVLGSATCRQRLETLSRICGLLVAAIPGERRREVRPHSE